MEEGCDGVNQHSVGRSGLETTGLFEGQDPFDPVVAPGTRRPVGVLVPEHPKAQGPFRSVVRGLNPTLGQKHPQRVSLPQQATREPSCIVLPVMILLDQFTQPGISDPPFSTGRRGLGHMTPPLQLSQRPGTTGRQIGRETYCQAMDGADEVCQAGLARLHRVEVHSVAITHQESLPVIDQGREGFLRPVEMKHGERHGVTGHHPHPLQRVRQKPWRLIDVVDRGVARLRGKSQGVRLDGLGHAVEYLLDRSQADGHLQHRRTKGLHDPPPVAVGPGYCAHEGTEAWPISRGRLGGHGGFPPTPAVWTPALMQHPGGHVQRNGRQLQHLMRVVRPPQGKRRGATRTPLGPQLLDCRGGQEHLAMARMARCTTRFARRGRCTLARLLVGRVRRRWPMGGGRSPGGDGPPMR